MERQCAWCLRLMDRLGEPISLPLPKRYEISHGMCRTCGALWLDQALQNTHEQERRRKKIVPVAELETELEN